MGTRSSKMAAPVIVPATEQHTATVIFLHGLGDTGHGWSGELQRIRKPHIKYICPTAPSIPVALNMGMRMPAWFNLYSLDAEGPQDEAGIKAASETIQKIIRDEESAGIPSERIIVGGFSMGGALALFCSLTHKSKLAGIIGLSTWLPLADQIPANISANGQVPIFMGHGDADDIVPRRWGQMTATALQKFNPNVKFSVYAGMGHSSCKEEMDEVESFIQNHLPKQ
ncbi:acyl-protein thioesterase 1 [Galendromus occidentalis]|uniref:palmitoyl-protein hydrolase n=1 Tax=Galendromus occidentalis TaxID=34638 RepID=A0AAJ6QVW3_9ACAR|nr:acyl-protein thioesterase 1 [Galendromus occidentalis]